MKLSMSLIAKYMKKYEPECHILEDTPTISGVRFFGEQPGVFSKEYVYLDSASNYFKDPHYADALLLANGQNQVICRGAEYETLLNDVLAAFDFYNSFEQKLYLAAAERRPLQFILDIIEQDLDCPFFVFDLEGNLMGECHTELNADDEFSKVHQTRRMETIILGQIFENEEGQVIHDLNDYPEVTHIQGQDRVKCVAMYLTQSGERIGFVLMPVHNSLEAAVGLRLEALLAKMCAKAKEFTAKTSIHQSNHSIFLQLLQSSKINPDIVKKLEDYLDFSVPPVLVSFQNISIHNPTYQRMICNEFEKAAISGIASHYEEYVLFLIAEKDMDMLLQLFRQHSSIHRFSVGISMPVYRMDSLKIACQQCLFALNYTGQPGVRHCRNLALPYLLQNLRETEMSANLIHPAIELLREYDKNHDTDLLQTLRVYVQNGCRQSDAAAQMHIHLNTLKYRIRRITELCNIDLKDYEELFYIQLSLAL